MILLQQILDCLQTLPLDDGESLRQFHTRLTMKHLGQPAGAIISLTPFSSQRGLFKVQLYDQNHQRIGTFAQSFRQTPETREALLALKERLRALDAHIVETHPGETSSVDPA